MRFALPKNRTAPLIVFAIIGILLTLTLASFYMNRMIQCSYDSQYEEHDALSEHAATLISQELKDSLRALQTGAIYIAKAGNYNGLITQELLSELCESNSYISMAAIDSRGMGFNQAGQTKNYSDEDYFKTSIQKSNYISHRLQFDEKDNPYLIQAVPIVKNGVCVGVLAAWRKGEISNIAILDQEIKGGASIYLINSNNELVSYITGSDIRDFNYDRLMSEGELNEESSRTNTGLSSIAASLNIRQLFGTKEIENTYIWTRKDLGLNDWSVLYGRQYTVDSTTREILELSNVIWIIIFSSIIFIFLIMIIFQRKSNKRIVKTLYLDPVTGGDNWYRFRINARRIINSKQFLKKKYALVNFDINRFKIINEAYGYHKGDEILKDIYGIVKKWIKQGEHFTRYAADQFYIIMSFQDEKDLRERIQDLNDRLHQLSYTKTAKFFYGVYHITERTDSIDRMGEFANVAKNTIKGNSEYNISFFDETARRRLIEEEEIESSMNEALKNEEFQVYLQPKYMAKEETIFGAEALVRWQDSSGKSLSPCYFIPVFEKNGFITQLDIYMVRKVCEVLRGWLDKGYTPLPISVNISRLHFVNGHLAETIRDIVDSYQVPHHLIELELTESAFLQDKRLLIDTVVRLRSYEFLVSMDDFGAGYSSLNSLKDLPLDVVKLDGELFKLTDEVERGLTVIRNTITMAKDLHMQVVAECIETKEQVEFLCTVGCDIIQGYYFAQPMPVDQFEQRYFSNNRID
jgi:diguanylate cyclase (GGDEF)-like protein